MPTAPTITSVSGNSFSVTVTPCGLDSDITLRDFVVLENNVLTANPTSYNKTSPTTIQYAGPTLPLTTLEIRRFTPRGQRQLAGVGITKVSSQVWNKEFDRRVRIQEEVDTFGAGGGFSVRLPIDTPYDVTWNGDTLFSPTRNSLYDKIETLAPLNSPTFTGTPLVPTQLTSDDSTRIASTAYVKANLTPYAPLASPTFSGNPTATTQLTSDNSTRLATTAYVKANLNSTVLTGIPTAPTPATSDNSFTLATTAYVKNNLTSYATLSNPSFTGTPTMPTAANGVKTTVAANMLAIQRACQPVVLATCNTGQVIGTSFTDVVFNVEVSDVNGVYNNTTGVFTAPYTGLYHIVAAVNSTLTSLLALGLCNASNAELIRLCTTTTPSDAFLSCTGSVYYILNSGDQVKLRALSTTGSTLNGGSALNYINIVYAGIVTTA